MLDMKPTILGIEWGHDLGVAIASFIDDNNPILASHCRARIGELAANTEILLARREMSPENNGSLSAKGDN